MSENSPHETYYPHVEPGPFITTADAPAPLNDLQSFQWAPAALSNFNDSDPPQPATFHNYEVPSHELREDTYGVHYTTPLLFSNHATPTVPMDAFSHQPMRTSAQPPPSLHPIQRMHSTNTISDHVSSYQLSEDVSQSSFPASTTNPRHQHPNNSKRTRVALKDFLGTDTYSTLVLAKETFTATAFSTGLFFRHRGSTHTTARLFRMMARDLIIQAANEKGSSVTVDDGMVGLLYDTLGSVRSAIKKDARSIVQEQYGLLKNNEDEEAYRKQGRTWEQGVAHKVQELLGCSGASNMGFTDGEKDKNGYPGRWNHPCCREILSKFLFGKPTALGHKFAAKFGPPFSLQLVAFGHTMAYFCLDEWTSGTRKSKSLEVVDMERKYNNIVAGMMMAENDAYAGLILKAMFCDWWDYALKSNGLEVSTTQNPFRKTYGPQSAEASQSNANLQEMDGISFSSDVVPQSMTSWDIASLSSAPQEGFAPFYSSGLSLEATSSSSWDNHEPSSWDHHEQYQLSGNRG